MIKLHSIRQQKKNPQYYWVTLSVCEGVLITNNVYRADENRFMPAFTMRNRHAVTIAEISLSEYPGIIAMCETAIKSNIFDKEAIADVPEPVDISVSITDAPTPPIPAAKPKKIEKPGCETYGLEFDRVTDADYSKLSEYDQAVYQLKFLYACQKAYPNHYTEASIENEFLNMFPDKEDLYFAAYEVVNGTRTKVT